MLDFGKEERSSQDWFKAFITFFYLIYFLIQGNLQADSEYRLQWIAGYRKTSYKSIVRNFRLLDNKQKLEVPETFCDRQIFNGDHLFIRGIFLLYLMQE